MFSKNLWQAGGGPLIRGHYSFQWVVSNVEYLTVFYYLVLNVREVIGKKTDILGKGGWDVLQVKHVFIFSSC